MNSKGLLQTLLLLVCLYVTLSILIGCKGNQQSPKDKPAFSSGVFKMNCVLLYRDSMEKWVRKGWTKPGDSNFIRLILLQSYSADAVKANSNNRLVSFAATSFTNVLGDSIMLQIDSTCVAKEIRGEVSVTNNYVNFKKLQLTNGDGSLKNDFTFIRFRPVQEEKYKPYISFRIEVVRVEKDKTETKVRFGVDNSDPCPRFCNTLEE